MLSAWRARRPVGSANGSGTSTVVEPARGVVSARDLLVTVVFMSVTFRALSARERLSPLSRLALRSLGTELSRKIAIRRVAGGALLEAASQKR
jgi:hypothetical protein